MNIKVLVSSMALATGVALAAEPILVEVKPESHADVRASAPVAKPSLAEQQADQAKLKLEEIKTTQLTVYGNSALVNQQIARDLAAGDAQLWLKPDTSFWDMKSLMITAGKGSTGILPTSQSWLSPLRDTNDLVSALVGKEVELIRPNQKTVIGQLQAWNGVTGLLQLANQQQELFQWSDGFSLRSVEGQLLASDSLSTWMKVRYALPQPVSQLELSYFNGGLSFTNQYRMVMNPSTSKLTLALGATITNNSHTSYEQAAITLAAGDSGQPSGMPEAIQMRNMVLAADSSQGMGGGQRTGELLFTPVAGSYDLPARGSVSVFFDREESVAYRSDYRFSFYGSAHSGNEVVSSHPTATLRFTPEKDLPAGAVQIFASDEQAPLRMVYRGQLPQSAGQTPVDMEIGEAYGISIERSRLSVRQDRDGWEVDWQLRVTNSLDRPVRLYIEDSSYQLIRVSRLMDIKRDGVELYAEIPAQSTKIQTFTSLYSKK